MKLEALNSDEHIFSGWTRSRLMSAKRVMSERRWEEYTGLPRKKLLSQTPLSDLSFEIIRRYGKYDVFKTETELLLEHTTAPTWLLVNESLSSLVNAQIKRRKASELSSFAGHRGWRFCLECVKEERECYGYSYWHASHHLFGATICSTHKVPLRSNDALKVNDYKLPHQWLDKSNPMELEHEWQYQWQPFIYQLSEALKYDSTLSNRIKSDVLYLLQVERDLTYSFDKDRFNELFQQMYQDLGDSFFTGMIGRYAKGHKYGTNLLWLAISDFSAPHGIKSPIYWLSTIFWLRHKLPSLNGVINDDWNLQVH